MSDVATCFDLAVDEQGLATLTFDLPDKSVNIFTRQALEELEGWTSRLRERTDIRVLLLRSGKPGTFIAGADIDLIAEVTDPLEAEAGARQGQKIFAAWAGLPFPTVAAVQGTCLGGGTELALASDLILISDSDRVRIGLPETQLGILPAWGGCTRLPRRVDIADALDVILAGKRLHPKQAFRIGLADALLPDARFEPLARELALRHLDGSLRRKPKADFKDLLLEKNPVGRHVLFDQARKRTLATTEGHYPAPLRAIEVIRVGIEDGMEAGFEAEARAIGELATSAVCKNLIHVFRGMELAKHDGRSAEEETAAIRQVGVLGAGVMGGGIAQLIAAEAGIPVRLKDIGAEQLATGVEHAAGLFRKLVEKRRLSGTEAARRLALVRPTLDYSGFGRCDVVIEAIVENLGVKQKVFAELAEAVSPAAVLATNTSSLPIGEIGARVPGPERVVGMHFFNPVHRMPLVEVISSDATSPSAAETVAAFARALGKTPVLVRDEPGFLVNRLLMFYGVESLWLLEEGHRIEDIDRAMTEWGMPMGPLALNDEVGIDVAVEVGRILHDAFGERLPVPAWLERALEDGRLGRKNGRGFYTYDGGERGRPDESIYAVLGVQPRIDAPDPVRLAERMVLRMVDEAARCLDARIVKDPRSLDLALILGTGFPPFRGGLCRWADTQSLDTLIPELERLAEEIGPRFTPSEPLRAAASSGGFYAHPWPGT
ncbi:MAG: 3-hydroxyacyl-CoA dehydrogenase NAD-binding domain-containing protein [Thermoanaerobaculia bacterium]